MLAAGSRATTRDLMARMGHDSMAAALIYQHASREADQSIAAHLDAQISGMTAIARSEKGHPDRPPTGVGYGG
ncbi:MAG: hypothetical protein H0T91_07525 [Propionibacteriaceae bacterium]|nr:hypothetical protein [Propionibacteriaceae bacterium]